MKTMTLTGEWVELDWIVDTQHYSSSSFLYRRFPLNRRNPLWLDPSISFGCISSELELLPHYYWAGLMATTDWVSTIYLQQPKPCFCALITKKIFPILQVSVLHLKCESRTIWSRDVEPLVNFKLGLAEACEISNSDFKSKLMIAV